MQAVAETDFSHVTEIGGQPASAAQLARAHARYSFAVPYCEGREVLEVACGVGQGLGLIGRHAKRVVGIDIDAANVARAEETYRGRPHISVQRVDAHSTGFEDASFDVIILFEALYYLDAERFAREARRILRPGGVLLVCTANKDLPEFNPSPSSTRYLGLLELSALLSPLGFEVTGRGQDPIARSGLRALAFRGAKKIAVRLGLIPKTMRGKAIIKRIVFGRLAPLPDEILDESFSPLPTVSIPVDRPDRDHQVLYCIARLRA